MAAGDPQAPPAEPETTQPVANEPAPGVPDYLASPNAVFDDAGVQWRYGKAPDYSKTRKVWEETRKMNHVAGSLPQLVENLVKNWEVEASFKPRLEDWRTIDHANYAFAINGGPPQTAEHMLKVGTYNAIIAPNEYYSPGDTDFEASHKVFKRMMPTFAWEVMEVYSGPPTVTFKWRHWGVMKSDYVGFNDKGEKVVAKAHGGPIEVFGVTVATVDDKVRLQTVDTWFDPMDLFRQIVPSGVVSREAIHRKTDTVTAQDHGPNEDVQHSNGVKIADERHISETNGKVKEPSSEESLHEHISNGTSQPADTSVPHQTGNVNGVVDGSAAQFADMKLEQPKTNLDAVTSAATGTHDAVDKQAEGGAEQVHSHPHNTAQAVQLAPGEAVMVPADSEETRRTHEEMSKLTPAGCPFLMNKE